MAKDPTQGPVSTYDTEGNPIKTNVEEAPIEETVEETTVDESDVEETEEEVGDAIATPPDLPENYAGGTEPVVPVIEGEDESSKDGIAPTEDLWNRLTEVGAESDPDTGVVRHVEFTCDRCGETKEGMLFVGGETAGFYPTSKNDEELVWAKYTNEGEEILCDACMQSDERYLADYPDEPKADVEETVEETVADKESEEELSGEDLDKSEDDVVEKVAEEEEEDIEIHEHEIGASLTYTEAEKQLKEAPYMMLREMAVADELKPERSKAKIITQLLNHWFAEPPAIASDESKPMSARVRRIKEASSQ